MNMQEDQNVGHIVGGQLHSECNDETGCGEKYEVEGTGQVVELERDEAVIIPEAFDDRCFSDSFCDQPIQYKMTGTISQIASAINQLGGGADFSSGAKVWKNGRRMKKPRFTVRNQRRKNPSKLKAGSVVINRTNMLNPKVMTFEGTAYEIASQINSYGGNGVKLMEEGGSLNMGTGLEMKKGGQITQEEKDSVYKAWKNLVNMSLSELRNFYDSEEGKEAGLSKSEADKLGINYGRESARWIMNMKQTPEYDWTPKYWEWAKKQIAFIKRMRGNKGGLYDDQGNKTRKHTSLLIWGHDPEKFSAGGGVETRYVGEGDFYVYAENDKEAEEKARSVMNQISSEHQPKLNHLYEQPFATRFTRKLFKSGGEINLSEKKMAKVIEDAIRRQKDFTKLKKIELKKKKKGKNPLPVEIATMVMNPIAEAKRVEDQRKQLLEWSLDPKNEVKYIVAFSGGKDSVAMVLKLMFEYNVPCSQIELWHHEVDGFGENLWDWKCTPSYCEAFAKAFGLKLLYSYREGGITKEILKGLNKPERSADILFQTEQDGEFIRSESAGELTERLKFPAIVADLKTRWCSGLVKIDVMSRAITNSPNLKNVQAIICTGERRDEGGNRATYMEIEPYSFSHGKNIITWRPVLDMTEEEIWDLYKFYGVQPHPAYELGWGRCSCQTCIFNSANYWATINEISPEKIDKIADIEKTIGNTLFNEDIKKRKWVDAHQKVGKDGKVRNYKGAYKMVSTGIKKDIRMKVAEGRSLLSPESKARWQKEATGEFVSPIFVKRDEWRLPDGAFKGENCGAT